MVNHLHMITSLAALARELQVEIGLRQPLTRRLLLLDGN